MHILQLKYQIEVKNSMLSAIHIITKHLPKEVFKIFTSDRDKEFACYEQIENELHIDFYFADPYSTWQRGSNENTNGLLREFFPKKNDLAKITDAELLDAIYNINYRPKKYLEVDTQFECFIHELNLLKKCRNNYCNSSFKKIMYIKINYSYFFYTFPYINSVQLSLVILLNLLIKILRYLFLSYLITQLFLF